VESRVTRVSKEKIFENDLVIRDYILFSTDAEKLQEHTQRARETLQLNTCNKHLLDQGKRPHQVLRKIIGSGRGHDAHYRVRLAEFQICTRQACDLAQGAVGSSGRKVDPHVKGKTFMFITGSFSTLKVVSLEHGYGKPFFCQQRSCRSASYSRTDDDNLFWHDCSSPLFEAKPEPRPTQTRRTSWAGVDFLYRVRGNEKMSRTPRSPRSSLGSLYVF